MTEKYLPILILAILLYFIYTLWNKNEKFGNTVSETLPIPETLHIPDEVVNNIVNNNTPPKLQMPINYAETESNTTGANINDAFALPLSNYVNTESVNFNKIDDNKFDLKSFLPQESNDEWFKTDFSQAKYKIENNDLINTDKYILGVNTTGSSKHGGHDIRGTIPNPKFNVSPWNGSSWEPDTNVKSWC